MPSAVAFLPPNISVFVNLEMSLSLNLGSGMIRRLGTSRRRGMSSCGFLRGLEVGFESRRLLLGPLDAVLRALAVTVDLVGRRGADGARRIERAADDVVAHAREVLDAAAADEDDRV